MILKYERACREAELKKEQTQSQTKKIRNYLDNQKKKVREEKKAREKKGIVFCSWEKITETGDYQDYESEDMDEMVGNKMDMEKLRECLARLSAEDREIILSVYGADPDKVNISAAARELDMPWSTVSDAHKRILADLKKDFFKNNKKS